MMDNLNVLNEHQAGWVSIILYQRWTGSYAVAKWDHRRARFVGDILVCASGIRHAHQHFKRLCLPVH
jgi:hypothetical protein